TQFGLLNTPELWLMCLVLIIGAIVGKFGGAFFSTRFLGESLKDSLYMGALMNTRGLMELVVLTIGYEMGILPPAIFVMLVIMTLVTTFMTAPLVSFIKFIFRFAEKGKAPQEAVAKSTFKLLLSFGRVSNGEVMLDLAGQLFSKGKKTLDITALHLTVGAEVNPMQADNFEQASFGPILDGARKLGLAVRTRYEVSDNPGRDIVQILNQGDFDFLLVGAGVSMAKPGEAGGRVKDFLKKRLPFVVKASESFLYPGALLRDKTKIFMEEAHCAVGVFINRNFIKAKRILVLMASPEEAFLETYARTLAAATNGTVTLRTATSLSTEPMTGYDFMLISYACWSDLSEHRPQALQNIPSTLILNK
ncbi:MAG: cation:proton antiporter, partial [Tannerella sp.]|nr:cation:proton antiporter [Tannerella sp.]